MSRVLMRVDDRMKPIVNGALYPNVAATAGAFSSSGSSRSVVTEVGTPGGSTFARLTSTGASAVATVRMSRMSCVVAPPVFLGLPSRMSSWVRTSVGRGIRAYGPEGPAYEVAPAGVWTRYVAYSLSTGGALYASFRLATDGIASAETVDATAILATFGRDAFVDYAYADGSTPGWKWLVTTLGPASGRHPLCGNP